MINADDCWLWAGLLNGYGYGIYQVKIEGKWRIRMAHRMMYENFKGEIPEKYVIDHLCRVTQCVNPVHLEAVTDRVNIMRGIGPASRNKKKTHCPKGHPYSDGYVTKQGYKKCKQCLLQWQRNYRAKKKLS